MVHYFISLFLHVAFSIVAYYALCAWMGTQEARYIVLSLAADLRLVIGIFAALSCGLLYQFIGMYKDDYGIYLQQRRVGWLGYLSAATCIIFHVASLALCTYASIAKTNVAVDVAGMGILASIAAFLIHSYVMWWFVRLRAEFEGELKRERSL